MDKECTKCKEVKSLDEFWKDANLKDGVQYWCKKCAHAKQRPASPPYGTRIEKAIYKKELAAKGLKHCPKCDKEKSFDGFARAKERKDGYNGHCKECQKNYRIRNKEMISATGKKYREENKEYFKEYSRNYQAVRRHRYATDEEYRKREKANSIKAVYKRRETQPLYRLRERVSTTINKALARNKGGKDGQSVLQYLPYTIEELKEHLENQFQEGMTWNNHGVHGWHLDHIIPQSKLIYDSMDHPNFQKCWALENLQPLWAKENISKSNKIL